MNRSTLIATLALAGAWGCMRDIPKPAGTGGVGEATGGSSASNGGATGGTTGVAGSSGGSGGASGDAAVALDAGGAATGGAAGSGPGTGGVSGVPDAGGGGSAGLTAEQVKAWAEAYRAAHPGNGGKDRDLNAKTPAQLAADPVARQLLAVCGPDQRPVIPILAWEYGGADHPWINPAASALVYCVYIPVKPSTAHWRYDLAMDRVTADVYVRFPAQNPCKDRAGRDQVMACLGDPTNIEILVDTTSLGDGAGAGLSLSNSSTQLQLILPGGMTIPLYLGL
jgi:hypothetical protein